jgi:hypothetical protein
VPGIPLAQTITEELYMKKLAILAALVAGAVAAALSFGSSHSEAPGTAKDGVIDNTDTYAFVPQDAPNTLTVVANWIGLKDPESGPYFLKLDPKARYYINVDNDGDGVANKRYRFQISERFRNPNSFLDAAPVVTSIDDPDINYVQTYDLIEESYNRNGRLVGQRRLANDAKIPPSNIGPKTIPNYAQVSQGGVTPIPGGGKVFVGQCDDPFYVDLGAVFDGVNIDKPGRPNIGLGNQGNGRDAVAGYSTMCFALQVPKRQVTRDGRNVADMKAPNAVVGVWASSERRSLDVRGGSRKRGRGSQRDGWKQVSRLGVPLVNEVVIPVGQKDKYNRTQPKDDGRNFGRFVVNSEVARILNALFGLGIQETGRTDLVQALLQGVPGLNQLDKGKNPLPTDTLKINLGVPPNPNPNRFGVLAGDLQGFPNGRRLIDDPVDIELRAIAGALLNPAKNIPLGDGVDQNDKPFRSQFPYVALPNDGFNSTLKRIEPGHAPVPQPPPAQLP